MKEYNVHIRILSTQIQNKQGAQISANPYKGEVPIMGLYENLVDFLNDLDDFFIEVEGKPEKLSKFIKNYNSKMGTNINMDSDGICELGNVNKWGLEFRVYTNKRPQPLLGNKFHRNPKIRHPKYKYRLSKKDLVKPLLYDGFELGQN